MGAVAVKMDPTTAPIQIKSLHALERCSHPSSMCSPCISKQCSEHHLVLPVCLYLDCNYILQLHGSLQLRSLLYKLGPSNPITVGHGECLGDVAKNLWTGVKSIEKVYRSWIGVEVRGIVDGSPKALKQPLEVTSVRDTLGLRKLADFRLRFIRRLHASRFLTIY
ncbi:uncharacterized protein [Palaemon carinicauda]